jgi:hypothetical protein
MLAGSSTRVSVPLLISYSYELQCPLEIPNRKGCIATGIAMPSPVLGPRLSTLLVRALQVSSRGEDEMMRWTLEYRDVQVDRLHSRTGLAHVTCSFGARLSKAV